MSIAMFDEAYHSAKKAHPNANAAAKAPAANISNLWRSKQGVAEIILFDFIYLLFFGFVLT